MAIYTTMVRPVRILFIAFITAVLLSACSAIDSRISQHEGEFKAYSPEIQALIKNGQIRPGFTETQVYISWGEPYYRGGSQWTYPGYDCKKFQVSKDEWEYRRQYQTEWDEYQDKKKHGHKEVFIPPSPYKEENRCRRFVKNYIYFNNGILTRIDSPPTITWIDRDWDYR